MVLKKGAIYNKLPKLKNKDERYNLIIKVYYQKLFLMLVNCKVKDQIYIFKAKKIFNIV